VCPAFCPSFPRCIEYFQKLKITAASELQIKFL
jgi:hypothetical protein